MSKETPGIPTWAAQAASASVMNLSKLREVAELCGEPRRRLLDFALPRIGDFDVIMAPPPRPKFVLAPGDYIGEEFRAEMQARLNEFFGYHESLPPKGVVYLSQTYGFAILHPSDFHRLASLL